MKLCVRHMAIQLTLKSLAIERSFLNTILLHHNNPSQNYDYCFSFNNLEWPVAYTVIIFKKIIKHKVEFYIQHQKTAYAWFHYRHQGKYY